MRKFIFKAEENLEKLRQEETEEHETEHARVYEKIKDNTTLLSAEDKISLNKTLTEEESETLIFAVSTRFFGEFRRSEVGDTIFKVVMAFI